MESFRGLCDLDSNAQRSVEKETEELKKIITLYRQIAKNTKRTDQETFEEMERLLNKYESSNI